MRAWHLFLLMAAVSCGTEVVQVDLPPRSVDTQSMLTGVLYDGRLSVYAIDLQAEPGTWELPAVERRDGPARFFTMHYADSLSEMRLEPGPLALVPDGDAPSDPVGRFVRTVSDGDEGAWAPVDKLSEDLQFKLPSQSKCRLLQVSTYELPMNGRVTVALPQVDGSIFAVGVGGQELRIDDTEISQLAQLVPASMSVLSGTETSSRVTWLSGTEGRLWAGRPGEVFRDVRPLAHGETTAYLAASTPGLATPAPPELMILSRKGTFDHLDLAGRWRSAKSLGTSTTSAQRQGGLYWLGLDRVAALVPGSGRYYRVDAGEVIPYADPPESYGRVVDIAANHGAIFGITSKGYLIRYNELVRRLTLEFQLEAALPDPRLISIEDGFLLMNRPGTVRHWYRPSGQDAKPGVVPPNIICPAVRAPVGNSTLWAHTVVGEKAYLFMSDADDSGDFDAGPATMLVVDFSER